MATSGTKLGDTLVAEYRHLRDEKGLTQIEAAARLGISRSTASKYDVLAKSTRNTFLVEEGKSEADHEAAKWSGEGDTATVEKLVAHPIRTLDEAIEAAGVDLSVWYVLKWEANPWTVTVKEKTADGEEKAKLIQNYRVWMRLERIAKAPLLEAAKAVVAELKGRAPSWPAVIDRTKRTDPYLLEIDLFDAHFGKLAWAAETGQDYDLKIADQVYRQAVEDLLAEFDTGQCERILLPIGNDFMHVDNDRNETTRGTRVDTDGRLFKILRTGKLALVDIVRHLASIAPVDLLLIPGNHDLTFAVVLAMLLEEHFRGTDRVTVDTAPKTRKYFSYGKGLIGFTHGETISPPLLPGLMAQEVPKLWAEATWREWHLGHLHKSKKFETLPTDTHNGTVVRWLRSLSATDAWHYRMGFVGGTRAAEAYRWRPATGYAGHAVAHVR